MTPKPQSTLLGQSSARYGVASLIAAVLAVASQLLVVVIGVLALGILIPLSLIAAICGLVGVGGGLYEKNWLGIAGGLLGMVITGWLLWAFLWSLTHF